jgi:putative nucleotide binding protein
MNRRDRYRSRRKPQGRSRRGRDSHQKKQFIKRERDVVILDVLLHGHVEDDRPIWSKESLVQVITLPDFVLYEVRFNRDSDIKVQEKDTYGNFRKENKLGDVLRKINYDDLTNTSKALIESIIENAVKEYEDLFINFFNNSTSITPRLHALKLLPGIGQKHMWEIIEARERQEFNTFQDIIDRTSISSPEKVIAQRIIKELQREGIKYYIFSKTKKYE